MFYYLSQAILEWSTEKPWASHVSFLRLFQYITVRSAGAALTALLLSLWLGPKFIVWLKQLKFGQDYADKAEEAGGLTARLLNKKGTPTMGGILIITTLNLTTLLWAQWNTLVLLTLLSVIVLAVLGFYDDYSKIIQRSGGGTKPRVKLTVQIALALFVGLYLWKMHMTSSLRIPESKTVIVSNLVSVIMVPFYKFPIHLGTIDLTLPFCTYPIPIPVGAIIGLLLILFTIVGSSNAVNLTDGLDGLAIGCTLIVSTVFLFMTYLAGNVKAAGYLQIPYVAGAGELTVFCAAMIGAGMGFLWFNCHPAQMFMGDTGSLALGGALGVMAVLIHQPFVLVIAGGVFVMEAFSVILQRTWFRHTRKRYGTGQRLFLMAPLHHHFEKKGWYESQVVMRFYILCVLFAVVALSTLKIR
jgi:phospho-N-acetylmuramoyl-pentapeptide-transferase